MAKNICQLMTEFIRTYRAAGVPVSTQEAVSCIQALEIMDYDSEVWESVMRINLAKSEYEEQLFQLIWKLYFSSSSKNDDETTSSGADIVLSAGTVDGTGRGVAGIGGSAGGLLAFLERASVSLMEELAASWIERSSLQCDNPDQIQELIRMFQIEYSWFEAVHQMDRSHMLGKISGKEHGKWQERFQQLEKAVADMLCQKSFSALPKEQMAQWLRKLNIYEKDFQHLSELETGRIEHAIHRLAQKLANRPGIRMRRSNRGVVDIRRTFQHIVKTNGLPFTLCYRDHKKSKTDLWLLCDLSNSVSKYSQFMLQLVQGTQKRYARVRSFVFVDTLVEVSELLRMQEAKNVLVQRSLRDSFSRTGFSRYDQVFEQLLRQETRQMNEKTKILILGDGKNNWLRSGVDDFAKIADRVSDIYWLNPMPRNQWEKDDCLMKEYEPYCRQTFECRNYQQLSLVARYIL